MRVVFLSLFWFVLAQQHVVENGVCYKIDDNGTRVIEDCVIPPSSTLTSTSSTISSSVSSPTIDDNSNSQNSKNSADKIREVGNLGALVMFLFGLM
jgi:hypothetical protein